MKKYLTEFVGTFFLVLTICMAASSGSMFAPITVGSMLMVLVYMGGHVSGAHYNPAASLAFFLRGRMAMAEMFAYWIVQVIAAIVASFVAYAITAKSISVAPGAEANTVAALLVEFLFTFVLALVILNVATSKKTEGNSYYGLAIGFTVLAAMYVGSSISGAALNPAVGIGPNLAHLAIEGASLSHIWIYFVGPLAGGAVAAAVFKMQNTDD